MVSCQAGVQKVLTAQSGIGGGGIFPLSHDICGRDHLTMLLARSDLFTTGIFPLFLGRGQISTGKLELGPDRSGRHGSA